MPKIAKDAIDIYFEHGIDQINRRIFLYGDVDEDQIGQVIKGIFLLRSLNKEKSIEIYVGTLGGNIYEMFGLYDVIRNCDGKIITIGMGKVMSSGILILAAGDEKKAFRNTSFMMHEFSAYGDGEGASSQRVSLEHIDDLHKKWAECMEERTRIPVREWYKMLKSPDYFFDIDEAIDLKIVDEIIPEKEMV